MNDELPDHNVFNVGNGTPLTIKKIAETLAEIMGVEIEPEITHEFRKGDVRHCIADISKIRGAFGYVPKISFKDGMTELIEWTKSTRAADGYEKASSELEKHGLLIKRNK